METELRVSAHVDTLFLTSPSVQPRWDAGVTTLYSEDNVKEDPHDSKAEMPFRVHRSQLSPATDRPNMQHGQELERPGGPQSVSGHMARIFRPVRL